MLANASRCVCLHFFAAKYWKIFSAWQKIRHTKYMQKYMKGIKRMEIKRLTTEELQAFARLKDCKIENLYYRGDISLLQKPEKIIALIGRRNADADVLRNAKRCGKILAESGTVTLNGLAVGCDTAGLEGALAVGGKCIAVMPCGLDYIYPKCNDSLVESILKNDGCIVSEYGPGEMPEKWKFVKRDLLQAMIADKILVIDCDAKSGTMHAVREGVRGKKDIACIVRKQEEKTGSGNKYMIDNFAAIKICGEKALKQFVKKSIKKK